MSLPAHCFEASRSNDFRAADVRHPRFADDLQTRWYAVQPLDFAARELELDPRAGQRQVVQRQVWETRREGG